MNRALFITFSAAACAFHAVALEPAHISDDDTKALYARIERQTKPQEVTSPNKHFKAVYSQTHPGISGRNPGRVTIQDRNGRVIAARNLTEHGGRLVAVARWSPDSRFCVFTTISSGGHSPWQFEPYVFSVADSSFRSLGDSFDAVIDPEFRFEPRAKVLFTTRKQITRFDLSK